MIRRDRSVAIVGAGIGGLCCARQLRAAGFSARVFDKGRGVGGRLATRRTEMGGSFDHGAQYFTARDPTLARQVEQWIAARVVASWEGRRGSVRNGQWTPAESDTPRYVGVPGMTAIAKDLAADLEVTLRTRVTKVVRDRGGWRLAAAAEGDLGVFDILIVNAPAPQSAELLNEYPEFAEKLRAPKLAPCWALMLAFEERLDVPWDAAFIDDSTISWIARNSSKPGRPEKPDCWVLHATPGWSTKHLENSSDSVAAELLPNFWRTVGIATQPHAFVTAHRWRFALPEEPLEQRCLFDAELWLGACGDWCGGPRVEGAYLSGLALAESVGNFIS